MARADAFMVLVPDGRLILQRPEAEETGLRGRDYESRQVLSVPGVKNSRRPHVYWIPLHELLEERGFEVLRIKLQPASLGRPSMFTCDPGSIIRTNSDHQL